MQGAGIKCLLVAAIATSSVAGCGGSGGAGERDTTPPVTPDIAYVNNVALSAPLLSARPSSLSPNGKKLVGFAEVEVAGRILPTGALWTDPASGPIPVYPGVAYSSASLARVTNSELAVGTYTTDHPDPIVRQSHLYFRTSGGSVQQLLVGARSGELYIHSLTDDGVVTGFMSPGGWFQAELFSGTWKHVARTFPAFSPSAPLGAEQVSWQVESPNRQWVLGQCRLPQPPAMVMNYYLIASSATQGKILVPSPDGSQFTPSFVSDDGELLLFSVGFGRTHHYISDKGMNPIELNDWLKGTGRQWIFAQYGNDYKVPHSIIAHEARVILLRETEPVANGTWRYALVRLPASR